MGVERAVTRWYVQQQIILSEIATLKGELRRLREQQSTQHNGLEGQQSIEQRLVESEAKLRAIGACPKPMMG